MLSKRNQKWLYTLYDYIHIRSSKLIYSEKGQKNDYLWGGHNLLLGRTFRKGVLWSTENVLYFYIGRGHGYLKNTKMPTQICEFYKNKVITMMIIRLWSQICEFYKNKVITMMIIRLWMLMSDKQESLGITGRCLHTTKLRRTVMMKAFFFYCMLTLFK